MNTTVLSAPHRGDIVSRVRQFIDEHYAEGITAADVARALHYSHSHLTSVIRRLTGRPLGAWIIARRLSVARERLLASNESVAMIGASVGFRDAAYFTRRFVRAYGEAPGRWRRKTVPSAERMSPCPVCGQEVA
jgi:AraC-like DNA-binding protein